MSAIPDIDEDCTCKSRCGICYDSVGLDPEIVCPDCPIHGDSNIAKKRRSEILERIIVPDKPKEELTDAEREAMNEKSIQSSIATYDKDAMRDYGIY